MNCAEYEQALARLLADEDGGSEAGPLAAGLREHAAACESCGGSADLLELLSGAPGERDLVDDPGEAYWSSFRERLQPRLKAAPERSRGPWWAVAAAVLLVGLLAGWLLRGPGEAGPAAVPSDAGTGPTAAAGAGDEFPPSLLRSLDRASAEEVESQLAALEGFGADWGIDWVDPGEPAERHHEGAWFPEVEQLDVETRERLLEWLREQNRDLEGAQG